ncbi:MAG: hypothetical protein ACRCXL_11885, partial [Dermatophilaceae bacterium]
MDVLTPPPLRDFPQEREAAIAELLGDLAEGRARRQVIPDIRRRTWIVGGVAAAGVAVAGGAVVSGTFSTAPDRSLVRCHTTTDLGRSEEFDGTSVAAADADGVVTLDRAVAACADLWRQGVLTADAAQPDGPGEPGAPDAVVPDLVGCVDPDGFAAVFPGRDGLCVNLGLDSLVEVNPDGSGGGGGGGAPRPGFGTARAGRRAAGCRARAPVP